MLDKAKEKQKNKRINESMRKWIKNAEKKGGMTGVLDLSNLHNSIF